MTSKIIIRTEDRRSVVSLVQGTEELPAILGSQSLDVMAFMVFAVEHSVDCELESIVYHFRNELG